MSLLGSSIDDLKGVFNKRQGVSQPNRFMVYMQPPASSLLNLDINTAITGALSGNLNLGSFINDPRDVTLLCESCSLPGRLITTIDFQNYKQAIKIPYGFINEDVSFTFLLTGDYYMKKMFDSWMALVFDTEKYELQYKDKYVADVKIAQLNKDNIPIYTIGLQKAFPISINAISLDNNSDNTIQRVTVTMTYENFVVNGLFDLAKGIGKGLMNSVTNTFN